MTPERRNAIILWTLGLHAFALFAILAAMDSPYRIGLLTEAKWILIVAQASLLYLWLALGRTMFAARLVTVVVLATYLMTLLHHGPSRNPLTLARSPRLGGHMAFAFCFAILVLLPAGWARLTGWRTKWRPSWKELDSQQSARVSLKSLLQLVTVVTVYLGAARLAEAQATFLRSPDIALAIVPALCAATVLSLGPLAWRIGILCAGAVVISLAMGVLLDVSSAGALQVTVATMLLTGIIASTLLALRIAGFRCARPLEIRPGVTCTNKSA